MQKNLISIITPCYNSGKYLHRLFESILLQDYPFVEMFAIDDGSIDNTSDIINSYIKRFHNKGYTLTYVRQKNQGQSAALNNGLKLVSGEYLIWPDSDDYFRISNALTTFVDSLQKYDETYGVVRCVPTYVTDHSFLDIPKKILNEEYFKANQFKNCLYGMNFFWGAGNYMIRMSIFDRINPQREIYVEKDAGQNWQMLLPILYVSKCLTLKDSLFNILVRADSHCRGQYRTYDQILKKYSSYRRTIIKTLDNIFEMPNEEKCKYKNDITLKYEIQELHLAVIYNDFNKVKFLVKNLKKNNVNISCKQILGIKLMRYKVFKFIFEKVFRNIKKI